MTSALDENVIKTNEYKKALDKLNESYKDLFKNTQTPAFKDIFAGTNLRTFFMRTSTFTAGQPTFEQIDEYMKRAKVVASELKNMFADIFMSIDKGFKAMIDSIIQSIERLIAEVLARMVVFLILTLISGGTSELALGAAKLIKGGFGDFVFKSLGRGMAGGGTVPSGYPNDTYPALLSSGERVTPPGVLSGLGLQAGTVVFRIEGRDLVGVLNNNNKFIRNY
jgi:hypothetical protein